VSIRRPFVPDILFITLYASSDRERIGLRSQVGTSVEHLREARTHAGPFRLGQRRPTLSDTVGYWARLVRTRDVAVREGYTFRATGKAWLIRVLRTDRIIPWCVLTLQKTVLSYASKVPVAFEDERQY
jgi:hypothetical protein